LFKQKIPKILGVDYYHANFITGGSYPLIYGQGPINKSVYQFWALVIEQNCGSQYVNGLDKYLSRYITTKAFDDENNEELIQYPDVTLIDKTRVKVKNGYKGE